MQQGLGFKANTAQIEDNQNALETTRIIISNVRCSHYDREID